jgi:hypothetical protein
VKPALWFRIAAVLMLLFAVGHTIGFLTFHPSSVEGQNVWRAMNTVRFTEGSSTFSYGDFYIGFGLFISAFQLFAAWLVWTLGSMAQRGTSGVRSIAWAMAIVQLTSLTLSLRYFAAGPAILSALTAACVIVAALSTHSNKKHAVTNHLSVIDA